MKYRLALTVFALLSTPYLAMAQDAPAGAAPTGGAAAAAAATVPRLLRFSGPATTSDGRPWTGTATLSFTIYAAQQDGTPLWMETQNVTADAQGRYSVLLGSTTSEGIPVNLFTAGEPRWLGVLVVMPGEVEQPRVLLVSVPYAMKASDADTLGGLPASAYMLAPGAGNAKQNAEDDHDHRDHPGPLRGLGSPGFLSLFTDERTLGNSSLFESNGLVGLGTTKPEFTLDVNGTANFSGAVTFGSHVTFAPGQIFPGAGTITGLTAGTGLTGGGTSGMVTLNLNTAFTDARYAQLGGNNTFSGSNSFSGLLSATTFTAGMVTATSFAGNGAGLSGVNASTLGGLAPSAFVQTGSSSSPVTQNLSGAVNVQGNVSLAALNGVNPTFTVQDADGSSFKVTDSAVFTAPNGSGGAISAVDNAAGMGGSLIIQGNSAPAANGQNGSSVNLVGGTGSGGAGGSINLTPGTGATNGAVNVNGNLIVTGSVTCGSGCSGGGNGTVRSVASGFGLTGGPITTSGTLMIDTSVVPQLGAASNAFAGSITASSFTGIGAGLSKVDALTLGGNLPTAFATTGANNFTGNQNVTGNLSLSGSLALPKTTSSTVGVLTLGGPPFLHNYGTQNTFVGELAGNTTVMIGIQNTAVGYAALSANTLGQDNSAFGTGALNNNTRGQDNSAFGASALASTTMSRNNSAFGSNALEKNNDTGGANSAFGAFALDNLQSGAGNIAIGNSAGSNLSGGESGNIYIGNLGVTGESGVIRIGNPALQTATYLAGTVNATAFVGNGSGLTGIASLGAVNLFTGMQTITAVPTGSLVGQASLLINPASVPTGPPVTLMGAAVGSTQEMLLDSSGDLTLAGSLTLPNTTSATVGVINLGTTPFLHNYPGTANSDNTFLGLLAGNMTMDPVNAHDNTAVGAGALSANSSGVANSAFGSGALYSHTSNNGNAAFGEGALNEDTTGTANTAIGAGALQYFGLSGGTGYNNIAVGNSAGTELSAGSNNIYIGNIGPTSAGSESGMIRIGTMGTHTATFLTGNVTISAPTGMGFGLTFPDGTTQTTAYTGGGGGGGGTITGVTAGTGLAGGGTTGTVSLSLATASCPGGQAMVALPLICSPFATLGPNTFSGDQTITGNVTASAAVTVGSSLALPNTMAPTAGALNVGVITFGGTVFLHNYGTRNTFVGGLAGNTSTGGEDNTGVGNGALGALAGMLPFTGSNNSAFGSGALENNTTGLANSAFGEGALETNKTGLFNSAFGEGALGSLGSGSYNIAIGQDAGANLFTKESYNIYIGNPGVTGDSGIIRIGDVVNQTAAYITGIWGATIATGDGVPVYVGSAGQLGVAMSSRRYKHLIADMGAESDLLMKLRPVAFYYKPELDATQTRQYGLVAEEVAKVAPGLVVFDKDGKPETVRYHFVNAMLLNEVQKQQRQIAEQQKANEEQKNTIEHQQAEIDSLAARLAKLEALAAAKP